MLRQPWCAPTSIIEWSRLTVVETKWEGGDSCGYAEESLPSPAEFSFKLRPAFEMIFTWRQMPTAPMNMMWKTNKSDRMEKLKWAGWGGWEGRGEFRHQWIQLPSKYWKLNTVFLLPTYPNVLPALRLEWIIYEEPTYCGNSVSQYLPPPRNLPIRHWE